MSCWLLIALLLNLNACVVLSIEPISTTVTFVGALGLTGLYAGWDYLKCSQSECCHRINQTKSMGLRNMGKGVLDYHRIPWIDYNLNNLDNDLNQYIHGQHLVKEIISKSVRKHLLNESPQKALVMSFHGWTGGGKNYVSKIVAQNMFSEYKRSQKSKFVHEIISTHYRANDENTQNKIRDIVVNGVKVCERSLFIFDEIDKMPVGLIDVIKPFLDFHSAVNGIDYRKAIFIFLSNTGGTGISKISYEFWNNGKERTDIKMNDLDSLISSGAFNERGGLYKSDIVEKNLIDAFIPFLPLEKRHIKLCIKDYLRNHYHLSDPHKYPGEEFIEQVANEMEYFPPDTKLYSKTGCKRVANKVDVLI